MRGQRTWQTDAMPEELTVIAPRHPGDVGRVVIGLDAGLDRFPVPEEPVSAIPMQQGRRDNGFADTGVGTRYEEATGHGTRPLRTAASRLAKRSRSTSVRCTLTETRSRAVPEGTVGGRIALTSKPSA